MRTRVICVILLDSETDEDLNVRVLRVRRWLGRSCRATGTMIKLISGTRPPSRTLKTL